MRLQNFAGGPIATLSKGASRMARAATETTVGLVARSARRDAAESFRLEVQSVIRETASSRTLVLRPAGAVGSAVSRPFRAGQYLQITVDIAGERHRRSYSISSAEGDSLQITVKAVDDGMVSQHLVENVRPGDTFDVKGPTGRFTLPVGESDPALCFLAVGSGITPVRSMIATALVASPERRIKLVYANRNREDAIFAETLDELAAMHAGFDIVHVHSRPAPGWTGLHGRLDADRAVDLLEPPPDAHVFLCGPADLMDDTSRVLGDRGVPPERIHSESYVRKVHQAPGGAAAFRGTAEDPSAQEGPGVTWTRSGVTDRQRKGETLLAASQRVDADVAYICESGECGSCLVRVVSGDVVQEPGTCITEAEAAAGYVLACSAYARGDVVLDS